MRKIGMIILAIIGSASVWANPINDSIPLKPEPAMRITAKEIAHLPFTSIMEVLNGAVPFVFDDPIRTMEYNFIVDGRILSNPNAISVSQIELIEYYPVAFTLQNGIRSARGGTFVITTKKNVSGLFVRSLAGLATGTKALMSAYINGKLADYTTALHTHDEIGYAYNKNKLNVNTALGYTRTPLPQFDRKDAMLDEHFEHTLDRLRFSNFASYEVNSKLSLDASLALASQNKNTDRVQKTMPSPLTNGDSHSSVDVFFWNVDAGAQYKIRPNITNHIRFEYSKIKNDDDRNGWSRESNGNKNYYDYEGKANQRQFAVTNELKGNYDLRSSVELNWELLLRYSEQKGKTDVVDRRWRDPIQTTLSAFNYYYPRTERSIAIMPKLTVGIAKQFNATAGVTYDSWKNSYYGGSPSFQQIYPYGGVQWTMPKSTGQLTSLNIHSTYGTVWQDPMVLDYLDYYYDFLDLAGPGIPGPNPYVYNKKKPGHDWVSGVNAGFVNNKLQLSVQYINGVTYPGVYGYIAGGGYYLVYNKTRRTGWSAGLQFEIADKNEFSLSMKTLMFYSRYRIIHHQVITYPYVDPYGNADMPEQWQGSVQLKLGVKKFFMQANAMLRFSERSYSGANDEYIDDHSLNYLVAGYRFNSKIEFSVQAKNLAPVKQTLSPVYYGVRYFGVGIIIRNQ